MTGINEVGSLPEDVAQDMIDLLKEIDEIGRQSPFLSGVYLHARFEYIHPFADGNGRVGRTLLNYWFILNNHPPLIVFEEDKRG